MALADRLLHDIVIERRGAATPAAEDDWGQTTSAGWATLAAVKAWVQPLTVQEQRQVSGEGPVVTTHRVFMLPTDIEEADQIRHGSLVYAIDSVLDPAGKGHHLEVLAHQVGT